MTALNRRRTFQFFPVVWLVYMFLPVSELVSHPRTITVYLGSALLLAGFLVVFVNTLRTVNRQPDERWGYAGWAYCLLAYFVALPAVGGTATTFLIYGASLVGYQRRTGTVRWLVLVNMGLIAWPLWTGTYKREDISWLLPSIFFTFMAAYSNYARGLSDARLAQVQAEKEKLAQTAERERIARDLHDLLGHTLSVIVLKSELAARLTERDPQAAAHEIREVERISREALGEVRAAVRGYRGSGLGAELGRSKVALDAAGVAVEYEGEPLDLPRPVEYAMEMVLREAVTNVVRHAGAGKCRIRVARAGAHFELEVTDDGSGGLGAEGTGLTSMRERVRAVGGELNRDGRAGTRILARFPAEAPGEAAATRPENVPA